ncbi:hypothetical protein M5689_005035 [Euphorbia peplus]|nr:hypothetical protein M5689_005035 [Euphorbia peplus]
MTQNRHLLPSSSKSTYQFTIKIPENLETTLNNTVCIYTVPPSLRRINPLAYTPQVISIGPIHHGKNLLPKMEIQKLRYLNEFCRRKTENKVETLHFSQELLNQIDVEEIRSCYSFDCSTELNQISDEEVRRCYNNNGSYTAECTKLVNLILLDSIFVIELFLRRYLKSPDHLKDFVLGKPWLKTDVQQDLILLENQIPFSVLEKLYNFAKEKISGTMEDSQNYPSFIVLTCNYFLKFKPDVENFKNPKKILHFTDLVRYFWSYKHPNLRDHTINPNDLLDQTIRKLCNITKLYQAGLKLVTTRKKGLLDVEFRPGKSCVMGAELELPTFEVDDATESIVRNLMALEQCHYPAETYVCSYIRLLDLLIDTAEDVDLLVEKKIIENGLGNGKAVAKLVNKLCDQIVEVESCYFGVAKELNTYYGSCGNHTMATLRSVYFGDLWGGTATVAAIVLLVLTLIGTVCSILQVKDGSKGS